MHPNPSTELALKAFEADVAFSAALAQFQKDSPEDTIYAEARRAADHGFSWFCRPSKPGFFEVRLRHSGGAEISADGESITALLAGLLGHPLAPGLGVFARLKAAEPEQEGERDGRDGIMIHGGGTACGVMSGEAQCPVKAPPTSSHVQVAPADVEVVADAVEVAAESLAAATGGAVVLGPTEYIPDPDEAERTRLAGPLTAEQMRRERTRLAFPLTAEQRGACVHGIKLLTTEQRKSFTIAFRDAFKVSREEKAITPLITQVRHMEFCDRYAIEAAGGVAP